MDIQVAQPLFDAIDAAAKTQMGNVNKVMSVAGIVVGAYWMIHILMQSLFWYFDGLTVVIKDVLATLFKASCIMFMAFSVSWYVTTIVPTITELPVWLGNTISGVTEKNTNLVDTLIDAYVDGLTLFINSMKFNPFDTSFSISKLFYAIVGVFFYIAGGVPFIGVAVGTLITLKASTTLIMVVGPIFIALALFPKTQQYFWGWVGVLGGFILTQALFAIVLALEISFINSNVIKDGTIDTDLGTCFSIFVFFGAFTMLATEIPNYAASIMCGAPSGGVGFGVNTATQIGKTLASKLIEKGRKRGNHIS
ncbi:type IV secretion system protein [Serratia symbiotica]|uniref:type IV secretion system protein n=1 Tax=Serratia symbiotica TaxID=138074 RepID=UPI00135FEDB0|nr:type IV secretion system protein [Serratia symbiotica]MBQ0957297.1 type IV secretion system protein [Serratia symbiotica]